MPRNPNKTPCAVPGCRAWAIRGSSPPRCSPHRHSRACPESVRRAFPGPVLPVPRLGEGNESEGSLPPVPGNVEKDETRPPPQEPLAASLPGVGAPPGNQNHLVHGFYSKILLPEEHADLVAYAANTSLEGEIAITRVALRRILGMLLTSVTVGPKPVPLDAQDYARFSSLAFQGAGTISRLLRARKALSGDTDELLGFLTRVAEQLDAEEGRDS